MGRVRTNWYNPQFGCKYKIINTKTNKEHVCTVATHKNKWGHARSPKGTPKGEEYFLVIINKEPHKILNSILHPKCLSENGEWEFINQRYTDEEIKTVEEPSEKLVFTENEVFFINKDIVTIN